MRQQLSLLPSPEQQALDDVLAAIERGLPVSEQTLLHAELRAAGCRVTVRRYHAGAQVAPLRPPAKIAELSPGRRRRAYRAAHGLFWREISAGK